MISAGARKAKKSKRANAESIAATQATPAGCRDVEELVRRRAYYLWEVEGRPHGRETDHWHRAQAEVQRELQRS